MSFWTRITGLIMALSLVAGLAPASIAETGEATPPQADSSEAALGEEIVEARRADAKTFTTDEPGVLATRLFTEPVHYRDDKGKWRDIDTTLVADGKDRARNRANAFGLSVGLDHRSRELGRLEADGARVGFRLEGARPGAAAVDPKDPSTIVYRSIMPKVDLRLRSTATGLKQELILDSKTAPDRYVFPLELEGVQASLAEDGTVVYTDEAGEEVLFTPPGWMRDSADGGLDNGAGAMSGGVTYRIIEHEGGPALELRLDRAWLDDPARVYPVLVDPDVTTKAYLYDDTFVQENSTINFGSDGWLRTGSNGTTRRRAFIRFGPPVPADGTHTVKSATLRAFNTNSSTCTSADPVYVRRVTQNWTSTAVWPGPSFDATTNHGSNTQSLGFSSACPAGWVQWTVTGLVQGWNAGTWPNQGLALVSSTTASNSFRGYYSNDYGVAANRPYLDVVWANTAPAVPSSPSPASGSLFGSSSVALSSIFSDADGDWGWATYTVERLDGSTWTRLHTDTKGGLTSYGSSTLTLSGLTEGRYRWRVRNYDNFTYGAYAPSSSSWYEFTVDTTAPAAPSISSSTHPNQSLAYNTNRPSFSWAAQDLSGINGYSWVLDQAPSTTPNTTSQGTATSMTSATLADGIWWLHVRARNGAGLWGATQHFKVTIDTAVPSGVTISSTSHPDPARWYQSTALSASWTSATDSGSGIAGYLVTLDNAPTTAAETGAVQTGTTWSGTAVDNGIWYLHVRARDKAGNLGPVAHYRFNIGAFDPTEAYGIQPFATWTGGVNGPFGNFVESATDFDIATAGPGLDVQRNYNSMSGWVGEFGAGWTHSYGMVAVQESDGSAVVVYPDGRRSVFTPKAGGGYDPPSGSSSQLASVAGGGFTLSEKDRTVYSFDSNGDLVVITDAAGRRLTLVYDTTGNLTSVTDVASGRKLTYTWSSGKIASISTGPVAAHGGTLVWRYYYSGDLLVAACDPRDNAQTGLCTRYAYTGGRISQVTQPAGNVADKVGYAADGRVLWKEDGQANRTTFHHPTAGVVDITNPRGAVTRVVYDSELRTVAEQFDYDLATSTARGGTMSYRYTADGYRDQIVDPNGTTTTFTYDPRGNELSKTCVGCAGDGADETTWSTYDANDNLVAVRDARSSGPTDDRYRIAYTYNAAGELLTETGPPLDGHPTGIVTLTRTYTSAATSAVGGGSTPPGLLASETDAAGAATTYSYDAKGDLVEEHEPAGSITRHVYDELGRRTSTTEVSAAEPSGATTTFAYDRADNVTTETGPAVENPVTGAIHRARKTDVFDGNGNLTSSTIEDVTGGGTARTTRYAYDGNDREISVTDAEGGVLTRAFDGSGNVIRVTDAAGRITETSYNARNLPTTVTLANFDAGDGSAPAPVVLQRLVHDPAGRVIETTDAAGHTRQFTYDGADRLLTDTLTAFTRPDGTVTPVTIRRLTYDRAGNLVTEVTGDGAHTATHSYDAAGQLVTSVMDPGGLDRTTTASYDIAGNPTVVTLTDGTRTEERRRTYDPFGRMTAETVENGDVDLVTRYRYDDRGLLTDVTDPRGGAVGDPEFTTSYGYDLLGRRISVTGPEVEDASTATTGRPRTLQGYDAFGDVTHTRDVRGSVTTTAHDRTGRATTITHPAYTPPGGTEIVPTERFTYDAVGNVATRTTRRGHTYRYAYDSQNRVVSETAPAATTGGTEPVTRSGYDRAGNPVLTIDPTGARAEHTYDELGRPRTTSTHVRRDGQPTEVHVARSGHDAAGNLVLEVDPTGATTHHTYNSLGERVSTTDAAGKVWTTTFDVAGRATATTDPLGNRTETVYDLAGQATAVRQLAPDGTVVSAETTAYDAAGNITTTTTPAGNTTTRAYDGANLLRQVTLPVDAGSSITTTYGYDAAGNLVRVTDGRGNDTRYTYTPWDLPESIIEPVTDAHPDEADRTFTTLYDAGGLPVTEIQPGVSVNRTFDALGRMTTESGTGAGTPSADRTFGYDLAGRRTSFSHPAGTQQLVYDDRGLLVSATGPAGNASFSYDARGGLIERTDAAGTAAFTWTTRGELDQVTEPVTGQTLDHDWDAAGRLSTVGLGDGTSRVYGFDVAGRLVEDRWHDPAGTLLYGQAYRYDPDGNLTGRTVSHPSGPDEVHGYGYDRAGRVVSWTAPDGTVTPYGWDGSSNRISAGADTFTYDPRNRLTSGPEGAYTHTGRGTMTSLVGSAGTTTWEFDALGRMTGHTPTTGGTVTYDYDALDRVASRDTTQFAYTGLGLDPTFDGTTVYGRSPAGRLLALGDGSDARLVSSDRHGDVVALLAPTSLDPTAVVGTRSYTPFGQPHATTGTWAGQAGFQGDWTDPASGEVWQGARWYQPTTGVFTARDTILGELATPITLNRYLYANADPLGYFDPDGRLACAAIDGLRCASSKTTGGYRQVAKTVASRTARGTQTVKHTAKVEAKAAPARQARHRAETQRRVNNAKTTLVRDTARRPTTTTVKAKTPLSANALVRAATGAPQLRHARGFVRGAARSVADTAGALKSVADAAGSCQRNPIGCARQVRAAAPAVASAVANPRQSAQRIVRAAIEPARQAWARGEYGEAAGYLAPDIALALVTAGSATSARAGLTATRHLDNIPHATRVAPRGLQAGDEVFHYTQRQVVGSIQEHGLRSGSYATPSGNLSPLQAHIELSLPPNTPLRDAVLRVDVAGLRRAGYEIPGVTRVSNVVRGPGGRVYTMPGGGYELNFPYAIPSDFIKVVR